MPVSLKAEPLFSIGPLTITNGLVGAVLASLLLMRPSEMFPLERRGRPTIWRGTREGLGFARRSPRIVAILLTTTVFATLLFNFNILLPVLAKQTLHVGAGAFGLIMSAFGAGALVGALGGGGCAGLIACPAWSRR